MSSNRHEVFKAKVLKRLYPFSSENNNKSKTSATVTAVSKLDQKTNEDFKTCQSSSSSIGSEGQASSLQRKRYTVGLPPDDYKIGAETYSEPNEPEVINSEEDTAEDDTLEQIQRRRKRKKRKLGNSSQEKGDARGGDNEKPTEEKLNLTVKLSKNKKRKLKKKRHKEKLRSAGMIPKSMAVEFTYQPGESSSEDMDATERKAVEVLDFLQATQEIYFADRTSPVSEPTVLSATVGGVLNNLYTRTVPSSDVAMLYELKSLVLLQDIERLKSALEEFQDDSMMPPKEATAICSLFRYWITHILPMRKQEVK
ncbi:glutamate-rich protein 1 isoform X2 [Polyodon spathula]|uniref:glutamate-rich protein 1 isoform X2 n=1 Tax=Polyodon spathula TaxID=7913 RepID=UPI001B7E2227|nr:glutamate-rich protein 1 isoform X2 [Polyodon spathula]